ncbi:MAG: TauD/TfdA family dioxygenase [Pseudomonadota bacterium]
MTASLQTVAVTDQQQEPSVFPLVYQATDTDVDAFVNWISDNHQRVLDESAEHGAILFRGVPITTDQDFDRVVRAFGIDNFTYRESLSNAVRINRTDRVFTANEAPPDVSIYLHHEMAQTPIFPGKLFFFCEKAAEELGATPLCRSDKLYDALVRETPGFLADCERLGVRYSNTMPAEDDAASGQGRSWRSTLSVEDKAAAEAKLKDLGYDWVWEADGSLRATTPVLPAVRTLPSGRKVFFNQLIAAYRGWQNPDRALSFGDGSPLPSTAMDRVCTLAEELCFDLAWQTGDVAIVDNYVVMHGRRPFRGTRRVLVALGAVESAA